MLIQWLILFFHCRFSIINILKWDRLTSSVMIGINNTKSFFLYLLKADKNVGESDIGNQPSTLPSLFEY